MTPPATTPNPREAFLQRVRTALGRTSTPTETSPPLREESLIRQVAASDPNMIQRFIDRARSGSMVVSRIPNNPTLILAAIDAALAPHTIHRCLLNAHDFEQTLNLTTHLAARNCDILHWGAGGASEDSREKAFHCDASITDARAGIADAGSIMVWSDPSFGRSSTLVTPIHLILLPASRILPDLIDALAFAHRENPATLPSNIVLINGPSKTRDIEMQLVTGVHGPKHVYVILIDDEVAGTK